MFNPNEPLGLPRGSVRAILAIGLTGSTVAAVFAQLPMEMIGVLGALSNAAVLFYFKDRPTAGSAP